MLGLILTGCGHDKPPSTTVDACRMQTERPKWFAAMRQTEAKYGVPVSVQLATIAREFELRRRRAADQAHRQRALLAQGAAVERLRLCPGARRDVGRLPPRHRPPRRRPRRLRRRLGLHRLVHERGRPGERPRAARRLQPVPRLPRGQGRLRPRQLPRRRPGSPGSRATSRPGRSSTRSSSSPARRADADAGGVDGRADGPSPAGLPAAARRPIVEKHAVLAGADAAGGRHGSADRDGGLRAGRRPRRLHRRRPQDEPVEVRGLQARLRARGAARGASPQPHHAARQPDRGRPRLLRPRPLGPRRGRRGRQHGDRDAGDAEGLAAHLGAGHLRGAAARRA